MKKIFYFFKKYFKLLDRFIYMKIEDVISFRNTLVLVTAYFVYEAIKTKNAAIVGIVFGGWTIILTFYFYHRQKSQSNGFKTSNYDEIKGD